MNFKLALISLIVVLAFGCGVKSAPAKPADKAISSYIESYTNPSPEEPNQNKDKKK